MVKLKINKSLTKRPSKKKKRIRTKFKKINMTSCSQMTKLKTNKFFIKKQRIKI